MYHLLIINEQLCAALVFCIVHHCIALLSMHYLDYLLFCIVMYCLTAYVALLPATNIPQDIKAYLILS